MIFNFRIILYSARRTAITKKSPSLTTTNIEYAKNILLKILNSHAITKLNDAADFCSNKYKIITIIFEVIIWSSRCVIGSCAIHCVVQSRCLVDCKKIRWDRSNLCVTVPVSPASRAAKCFY